MTHKVYKLSFPDGTTYIGVTSLSLKQRVSAHRSSNTYKCGVALNKYRGKVIGKIIFKGTKEECYKLEAEIVTRAFVSDPYTLNETVGGVEPPGVRLKGKDNPMWKGGHTLTYCEECGKKRAKSCQSGTLYKLCRSCFDKNRAESTRTRCMVCNEFTSRPIYRVHRKCKIFLAT